MRVEHGPGVHDVAARLAHLLALFVEDVSEREDVAEGRGFGDGFGAVQQHGFGVQRVEPAARLIDRLADEVGGKALGEELLVLERVVPLGVGHCAAVEPGVGNLRHAARFAAAFVAADQDIVHDRPMRVAEVGRIADGAAAQLVEGADAVGAPAALAAPEGQRSTPVALAADGPIDVVGEPVAVAPASNVLGVPMDEALVAVEQRIAQAAGGDVPGGLGVVEQRRVAAPTERVGVADRLVAEQPPSLGEVVDHLGIRVLDPFAHEGGGAGRVAGDQAAQIDGLAEEQPLFASQHVVVLAESGRDVDDPGALLHRDEIGGHDAARRQFTVGAFHQPRAVEAPGAVAPFLRLVEAVVGHAFQLGAGDAGCDAGALRTLDIAERRINQPLGKQQAAAVGQLDGGVALLGSDGEAAVGGQRPGRGGPGEQVGGSLVAQRRGQ